MNMNVNDYLLIVYILTYFFKINGLTLDFDHCCICNTSLQPLFIDLNNGNSFCEEHASNMTFKFSENTTNLLKALFSFKYDLMQCKEFDLKEIKILIRKMSLYLYHTSGIYLECLKNNL